MKIINVILIGMIGLVGPISCTVNEIRFDQQCSGFIKQAADANTVEMAADRLTIAIKYAEEKSMTHGYTSIMWSTEDENIGFWYTNMKACIKELNDAKDASQLEKTNVLMKVREALMDGEKLTIPTGLCRYPNNTFWMIFLLVTWGMIFYTIGYITYQGTKL